MNDLEAAKRAAREIVVARRRGQDASAAGLVRHMLRAPPPPGAIVAGFWPMGDEIDIRPLLRALYDRGNLVALPVTPKRGEALTFAGWQPGDALVPERFGSMRAVGPIMVPDMLLVPLLAVDAAAAGWVTAAFL